MQLCNQRTSYYRWRTVSIQIICSLLLLIDLELVVHALFTLSSADYTFPCVRILTASCVTRHLAEMLAYYLVASKSCAESHAEITLACSLHMSRDSVR
jgi:NAD-dependent oxidoreductase involved in siderophore biosynthesis